MICIIPAIKSLKIRNLGLIRKADFKFTKGINIIYGMNGSGKTTVVNAIRHLINGEKLIYGPNDYKKSSEKSEIQVGLLGKKLSKMIEKQESVYEACLRKGIFPNGDKIPPGINDVEKLKSIMSGGERTFLEILETIRMVGEGQALLLDDAFARLEHVNISAVYQMFKEKKLQVIMTLGRENEILKGANVIRLNLVNKGNHPYVYSK